MSLEPADSLDPLAFATLTGVGGDTLERLTVYADALTRWQQKMNLVGPSTLVDVWRRHFLDSAQLAPLMAESPGPIVDMGSGAGFPGMVLAIILDRPMRLVESHAKKAAFLTHVAALTEAPVTVANERVEDQRRGGFTVVTARALAPLDRLLALAHPLLRPGGRCLFLKGRQADAELTESNKMWKMSVTRSPSLSDPTGCILGIEGLEPRHAG